jgi:ABC-type glycerol-3-phosphate transport system permease component
VDSGFASYFWSSTAVISAMAIVTILGAGAARALARYRLRGNRLILFILFIPFILFSSVILPPGSRCCPCSRPW